MFSIEDFIIAAFYYVGDLWSQVTQGKRIRQGRFTPSLNNSEVIAILHLLLEEKICGMLLMGLGVY